MKSLVTKLVLFLAVVVIAGGSYVMGHRNINPLEIIRRSASSTDTTAVATALYKKCSATGLAKSKCYQSSLEDMANKGQVKMAMRVLAALGPLDPEVVRDGHVFAHKIGMAAGRRGGNISAMFAQCDESNQSGCYHGVLQSYLIAAKHVGPAEVNAVCDPFRGPNADRWLLFQCVHGTGHGLTMYYNHDLPRALKDCDYLGDDWDRRSCYAGVFMENIVNVEMTSTMDHSHEAMEMEGMGTSPNWKPLDKNDLLYPCSVMEKKYLASCYEMQTAAILYENGGSVAGAAKTCDTAPVAMRYVCYQSLGRDISALALQDHKKAAGLCDLGTEQYRPWCYFGLVKSFVDMNARADDGINFCKEVTGGPDKLKCYEAVGEQIGTLRNDGEQRSALCQPSEAEYRDACLYGARVTSSAPPELARLNLPSIEAAKTD